MKEALFASTDKAINKFVKSIYLSLDDTRLLYDWYAYRGENRVIRILSGTVKVLIVKLDDWENPCHSLKVKEVFLNQNDENTEIILPSGFAVNFKAIVPGSEVEIKGEVNPEHPIVREYNYSKNRWFFESFF